ncbi:MAG TPA: FAD-dependent oxidoreductase [Synergistales bacterium]|nr:FAD-dependent oxidoreductase [Synergistales bacterium]HRV71587.1 FAD-dependent oxidoreductase [Thermovirgaceae bacterium]
MKYDVIIVGAGPSGLFAARELAAKGKKVAIIDKGKKISERSCPLKEGKTKTCAHCKPCNVICGWGGAGSYSDGKLTLTPEFGGNLESYIGRKELLELIDVVDREFVRHGASMELFSPDPDFARDVAIRASTVGLRIIPAKIRHMGTDRSKDILQSMFEEISRSCDVIMDTTVESVVLKEGRAAGVMLSGGETVESPVVLMAPGREGSFWMEKTVKSLGLKIKSLPVDIGVRVEIPSGIAEAITDQFYEVKAILDTPTFDDQVRTFCMCPRGEVTTEYLAQHDILTVNGHSNRDGNGQTGNTNFAILVSTDFTEPFKDPNGYGSHIARLANMLGGGVIVQRLGDLKHGRRSTPARIERGLVDPTLKTAEPGDLSFVLPYRHLKGILEMIQALDTIMPGINGKNTLLYGVEVKFYSLKLDLDADLMTNIPGLFASGDGAGVTRGVIQASASGIVAARGILKALRC